MPVHAALERFLFVLLKGVCRHGEDWDCGKLGIFELADCPCRLIAVHDRHLYIHQDELVVSGFGFFQHIDGNLAVAGDLNGEAGFL